MPGFPVSNDSKRIGLRMKQILKQLDVTQEQAALRMGLSSQGALGHYLLGRSEIPINVIIRFCSEFGVQINDLFDTHGDNVPATNITTETLFDILDVLNEFLAENHLTMEPMQRRLLVKHFYEQNLRDPARIKETLHALRAVNGNMFTKGK